MTENELKQRLLQAALAEPTELPAGLEGRLAARIAHERARDSVFGGRQPHLRMSGRESRRVSKVWRYVTAATIALLIALPILLHEPRVVYRDTCSSPEEAAMALQMALNEVSLHLTVEDNELLNLVME